MCCRGNTGMGERRHLVSVIAGYRVRRRLGNWGLLHCYIGSSNEHTRGYALTVSAWCGTYDVNRSLRLLLIHQLRRRRL